jgi:hypothetical protein
MTGESQNVKFIEEFIHNYFKTTLRQKVEGTNPEVYYNDIGLDVFTAKQFIGFAALWGIPAMIFGFVTYDLIFSRA